MSRKRPSARLALVESSNARNIGDDSSDDAALEAMVKRVGAELLRRIIAANRTTFG